jgi:hypothetical protein
MRRLPQGDLLVSLAASAHQPQQKRHVVADGTEPLMPPGPLQGVHANPQIPGRLVYGASS